MLRLAKQSDIQELKSLWMNSFDESEEFCNEFFRLRTKADYITVVQDKGRIISNLHLLPCKIHLGAQSVNSANLVGAATDIAYRGKGYMERLLIYSLALMRSRGQFLCTLQPFSHEFYRKYGWASCCKLYKYKVKLNNCDLNNTENSRQIIPLDISHLNDIYESCCTGIYLKRSLYDWNFALWDLSEEKGSLISTESTYAFCKWINERVEITEIAYRSEQSLKDIIKIITETFLKTEILINFIEPLSNIELLNQFTKIDECDYMMLRIIDLLALSGKISLRRKGKIVIDIIDKYAPWNQGVHLFEERNGVLHIQSSNEEPAFKLDIADLSSILWGYDETFDGLELFNGMKTIIYESY